MIALTLVRRIKARPLIVFEALSTAEGLTNWWGLDNFPVIAAVAEVRIGGHFRVTFQTADGLNHECTGEFLDLVRPERIVMSWRWVRGGVPEENGALSRVEMHLKPIETGTELTLVHTALQNDASRSSHERGWNQALDNLVGNFT